MRIIGGQKAGYIIRPPKNLNARPTTDIAKESLFNILNNRYHFEDLKVLDLFAGGGGMGLEFASRGSQNITAVDSSPVTFKFLKDLSAQLGFAQYQIIKGDAFKYLQHCSQSFDIIFADPPYAMQNIALIIQHVFTNNLLTPDGVLIIEHDKNVKLPPQNLSETRKYGQSAFSFYTATQ